MQKHVGILPCCCNADANILYDRVSCFYVGRRRFWGMSSVGGWDKLARNGLGGACHVVVWYRGWGRGGGGGREGAERLSAS